MREKELYKKKIIEMVNQIQYNNVLEYIYVIVKHIYEKAERSDWLRTAFICYLLSNSIRSITYFCFSFDKSKYVFNALSKSAFSLTLLITSALSAL